VTTFEKNEPGARAANPFGGEGTVDDALVEDVRKRRAQLGAAAPRVALFVFDCAETSVLERVLERIPDAVAAWFDEIVIVQERAAAERRPVPRAWFAREPGNLRVHRLPRDAGFGGARKAAFEYALRKGFDHVVFMRGDGIHPPEELPALVRPILDDPAQMVFAYRSLRLPDAPGSWRLIPNLAAHTLATAFQNRLLGLRLRDYHSGFRLYSMRAIERVPYQLNSDDPSFDMQLVIQCRVLGVPVREVPVGPLWSEYATNAAGAIEVLRASRCAIDYRLHQLHLFRLGNYFVDEGVRYTFKHSETGSHMQIVHAIAPGSSVLDLGCSQGLLAQPLREKGVRVSGVDIAPQAGAADDLEQYFQRDLDLPLDLPFGRDFDYVVVSDVIEHLRNRTQLLRGARAFLKEGGRLIISTPNIALWFYRLSLLVGRFEYGPRGVLDETHVHLFTRATFRREVEKAGFYILAERVTALPFEIVFESTGRSRLVRSMNRIYHTLARIWPTMFAYQHILEAEITTFDEESGPADEPAPAPPER
jgi:2-polyprenyl-3-methyl-5-hydroxy-6-metoxy-1,4-benzoquinol methylase